MKFGQKLPEMIQKWVVMVGILETNEPNCI